MKKFCLLAGCVLLIGLVAGEMLHVSADEKLTIKKIMLEGHKGEQAPIQTVLSGKADEALLKKFLTYYEFMAAQKPEHGDAASWTAKTTALVDATKGVIAKKDGSVEALKSAINCKACHTIHKPKK
jgi:hypothetical protein